MSAGRAARAVLFVTVLLLGGRVALAQTPAGLVGNWQGPEGTVQIKADGTMSIQGTPYRYAVQGNTMTLIGNDGTLPIPFQLSGNTLTVSLSGQIVTLTRITGNPQASPGSGAGGSGGMAELAGKWFYFSSFSANDDSISGVCLPLATLTERPLSDRHRQADRHRE